MPAAPEAGEAFGAIGTAEVFGENETKRLAKADGHIGIAGEVKIDLERESEKPHPGTQGAGL